MKYRSREDITRSILDCTEKRICKTYVMYGARLSWKQLTAYTYMMISSGLVSLDAQDRVQRTEKGSDLLAKLNAMEEMIAPIV
jgi:predicted transcriptional regulator